MLIYNDHLNDLNIYIDVCVFIPSPVRVGTLLSESSFRYSHEYLHEYCQA